MLDRDCSRAVILLDVVDAYLYSDGVCPVDLVIRHRVAGNLDYTVCYLERIVVDVPAAAAAVGVVGHDTDAVISGFHT